MKQHLKIHDFGDYQVFRQLCYSHPARIRIDTRAPFSVVRYSGLCWPFCAISGYLHGLASLNKYSCFMNIDNLLNLSTIIIKISIDIHEMWASFECTKLFHPRGLLQGNTADYISVATSKLKSGNTINRLPHFYPLFAFTIIHGSGRPSKNRKSLGAFIMWMVSGGHEVDWGGGGGGRI